MSILVITTGGTIGAMPYPDPQSPPEFSEMPKAGRDLVREILSRDFASASCRCVSLDPRDSKLIDQTYRDGIIKIIDEAREAKVLITHGTDTLLTSAEYFHKKYETGSVLKDKRVMLTGSMTPLSNGAKSDRYLTLKFSLEKLSSNNLKPGIYIVLCDYVDAAKKTGWAPRLYPYAPGRYRKYYDPEDGSRSRILAL